jgi:hypothetical protein
MQHQMPSHGFMPAAGQDELEGQAQTYDRELQRNRVFSKK